jgi:glycosyltransferase involved in cell wall biosynthesis
MIHSNSLPVFSVVIPTHNRAHLLARAIRSVLAQTFQFFELLIIDDASTDETAQMVKLFVDSRLRYIRRESSGGAAAARNTGIRQAKGEFITLLDDDDEYLPQFLEETYQHFTTASEQVGLSWCGLRRVEDTSSGEQVLSDDVWQPKFKSREHAHLSFLRSRRIGTNSGICIRKSCFDSIGLFDDTMRKAEDTDFFIRLVRQFDFVVVPSVLIKIHLHPGPRLTIYDQQMGAAYEKIIEKNIDALRQHPDLWAALHYKTGWLYYHGGDKTKARYFIRQALRRNPFHIKTWLGFLLLEIFGSSAPQLHQKLSLWKKHLIH